MSEKIDLTYTPISGPAIDALDHRKEADDGPTEHRVTKDAAKYLKRFGPPKWSEDVLAKAYKMGRQRLLTNTDALR